MSFKNIIPLFRIAQVFIDLLLIIVVYIFVFIVRFEGNIPQEHIKHFWLFLTIVPPLRIIVNYLFGIYKHLWKYFGMKEMLSISYSTSFGSIVFALIVYITGNYGFPRSIFIIEWSLMLIAFLMVRSSKRFSHFIINSSKNVPKQRVLIYGAGNAGQILVNEMFTSSDNIYMPIGFIDDDINKRKAIINGLRVFGDRSVLKDVVKDLEVDMVIICIPSANPNTIQEIVDICNKIKIKVNIIPSINEKISRQNIREIKIEDLLGRKEVKIDTSEVENLIFGKKILVTGAGGSIGSELCVQLSKFNPSRILLLGHGENSIFKISNLLKSRFPNIEYKRIIADIKDSKSIENIIKIEKPEIVFHTAAHKHLPLMEENLFEAILNNTMGTLILAQASNKYNVCKFINISTDKAVNPTSIMGMSKRMAEIIIKYYDSISKTEFITVRFGNVLGSRGSVIPIFEEQIKKGGPITITDKEMTRYFMSIPEAVLLILQAATIGKGSEIFVLDMGKPVKILDLAKNLIRLSGYNEENIPIVFTGARNGEKIHEELFSENEKIIRTAHEKIMISLQNDINEEIINKINNVINCAKLFDKDLVYKALKYLFPNI
jgi:FlaA1/EpsC-like NDP-sugar epimerase